MKMKRIITLMLVLSLVLMLLSSCAEAEDGYKAETTGNNTELLEKTGEYSDDTEQPESTAIDDAEQTESPEETTFPGGYDEETYNKLKEALVVLDDDTKAEIAEQIKEFSGLEVSGWTDESFSRWGTYASCYGKFENCIVIFYPMYSVAAVMGHDKIAGYDFWLSSRFYLFGYCNGNICMLNEAYIKGYISKEEVAIVHNRFETVDATIFS